MTGTKTLIITGLTACGKTETSIKIAKRINGEIISADSMQVYKRMDIGTAKIKPDEMQGIRHWLIDCFEPDFNYSVAVFAEYARKYIKDILQRGKVPIIVGGTGFYINALIYDTCFSDKGDLRYNKQLYDIYKEKGTEYIYSILRECDPKAAEKIHKNNIKRVIRAIEYYWQTGEKISEHNARERQKKASCDYLLFILYDERDVLYKKINMRVDEMIKAGLVEEVENLLKEGYSPSLTSMQGLGYKEILKYINGEISLTEAAELLKKSTRHFAKRQVTWFKNRTNGIWINMSQCGGSDGAAEKIIKKLKDTNFYE